jgi:UDPglucose 6-dehydrogenase
MEIAHKTPGARVDQITGALASAGRRLISAAYLEGGMGDGGGCHPKEAAAMSALARDLDLAWDPFGDLLRSRDAQAGWIADLLETESDASGLPIWVLGTAFKPEVPLEEGSSSLLVAEILRRRGREVSCFDPLIEKRASPRPGEPAVFLLATRHRSLLDFAFPAGSVVVDPWRAVSPREEIKVVPLGIG